MASTTKSVDPEDVITMGLTRTENPRVGGSIPPRVTIKIRKLRAHLVLTDDVSMSEGDAFRGAR